MCKTDHPLDTERPLIFMVDHRTDAKISDKDYERSEHDRGHMAPNAAIEKRFGGLAQLETFLMTNVCPQRATLNRLLKDMRLAGDLPFGWIADNTR